MNRSSRIPSYRLHKATGQAIVTVPLPGGGRHDVYLGKYGSADSRREYGRIVAELATAATPAQVTGSASSPALDPDLCIDELLLAFWRWAEQHYRRADGTPTHELAEYKGAFKPLRALYSHHPVADFGPMALKTVRQQMIDAGLSRRLINVRVGRIKRVFRWGASEQLVAIAVYQALSTVAGLQRGRTSAPDPEPIGPVEAEHVRAVLPYLRPAVAAMVEVQWLTGMRPGEVCQLRPCDIDQGGDVWLFRPVQHKTGWWGKSRVVAIGPRARAILERFTPPTPEGYYFSPVRAVEDLHAERTANRKTPRYNSHMRRNVAKRSRLPLRTPREHYDTASYGRAIRRPCNWPTGRWWKRPSRWNCTSPTGTRTSCATPTRRRSGSATAWKRPARRWVTTR